MAIVYGDLRSLQIAAAPMPIRLISMLSDAYPAHIDVVRPDPTRSGRSPVRRRSGAGQTQIATCADHTNMLPPMNSLSSELFGTYSSCSMTWKNLRNVRSLSASAYCSDSCVISSSSGVAYFFRMPIS